MKFFTCTLALLLAASCWLAQPTMTSQSAAGKSAFSRGSCPKRGSGSGVAKASRRILMADDDVTLQDVLTFFLGKEYEVRSATTGADALARVCHEPVDLVVLDHRLPDRTGLDVLAELKSIRPSLPVVMLTGYGSEWICAAAFKLGVADYLRKPVNAVDLVEAVRRILPPGPERRDFSREGPMLRGLRAPLCTPIQRAMGLIQERYWEQVSLSALAGQVGMSKYRLSHRFREEIGMTFRDYLLRVRIERAKVLLADSHVSISEVAQNVGFGDLPHFDKVFKRYAGITPTAYRSLLLSRSNT
jgi:two-component system, response regulator YesN